MAKKVIIIGAGIAGLSSAFYLRQEGFEVTLLERSGTGEGCSYGNAGYICPSHFVPMAAPGITAQAIKWMLRADSPFYVQPRLDANLFGWGRRFINAATAKHVAASAIPLRDIAFLSKHLYEQWSNIPGFDFSYNPAGLMEFFKTEENARHAEGTVKAAAALGISATLFSSGEVQSRYPDTRLDILGALYFEGDSQLDPNKLMADLSAWLLQNGVHLATGQTVTGFKKTGGRVTEVHTGEKLFLADHVVLAAGAWSGEIARQLQIRLPMVGGRGYSVTLQNSPYKVNGPVLLSEARVAISQLNKSSIRFGGTMEITALDARPRMNRVHGILRSVRNYFPDYEIPVPSEKEVWYGYRPCSADGLPYIGNSRQYANLTIATGHSMLGLSLGAATGKLVGELIAGKPTSINIRAFDPERFD